jgi:hypothetical protein
MQSNGEKEENASLVDFFFSLGLDGVLLYLLGYHDRHIDMMEELP